jgi:outer membrane biosynthesis protein TonB
MKKLILALSAIALLLTLGLATSGCERKESKPTAPEATTPRDSGTNGAVEKEALPGMEKEQLEETPKPEAAEPQVEPQAEPKDEPQAEPQAEPKDEPQAEPQAEEKAEEKAEEEKEQQNGATPTQEPGQQSPEY